MSKEKSLREYIDALPKQTLVNLLHGPDSRKIVSLSAAVGEIQRRFLEGDHLLSEFKGLPREAGRILRRLILEGSDGADIPLLLQGMPKGWTEDRVAAELKGLQNRLLAYGIKSTPYRYFVFREVSELLAPRLLEEMIASAKPVKNEKSRKAWGDALYRDTILTLLFLMREGIKKTKSGTLNKKQTDALCRVLEIPVEFNGQENGAWPLPFRMICGFLNERGLIEDRPEELAASEKAGRWLDTGEPDRARAFYRHLVESEGHDKMVFLLQFLDRADHALAADDCIEQLHARSSGDDRPVPGIFERAHLAGFMDLVSGEGQARAFALSRRGREVLQKKALSLESADRVTVMPTFEILAPRMLAARSLRLLFLSCHHEKSDTLHTFRLSRESLIAGFDRGLTAASFESDLAALAGQELPQNILFSIREWVASYGAVSFEMHFLLRVKKPELYDKVRAVLSGSKFLVEELPGAGFSIRASDYQEVFSILTRLGYTPKPFQVGREGAEPGALPRAPQNILDSFLATRENGKDRGEEFLMPEEPSGAPPRKHKLSSKYGGRMMALPFNEMVHVINYAILMEQGIEVEMKGGERFRFLPRDLELHLSEPRVSGDNPLNGDKAVVVLNNVDKIRVEE